MVGYSDNGFQDTSCHGYIPALTSIYAAMLVQEMSHTGTTLGDAFIVLLMQHNAVLSPECILANCHLRIGLVSLLVTMRLPRIGWKNLDQ